MFRLFKDNIEVSEMYLHSNNFEIISSNIIDEIYRPLLSKYQHSGVKKEEGQWFCFQLCWKIVFQVPRNKFKSR